MRVLVACEESQEVCKAFRARGHEAYSCDIQPCSGGHPEWHLQVDALELLKMQWGLIIAHPPCTRLTLSGNRWRDEKKEETEAGVDFFMKFTEAHAPRIAIENPVGIMSHRYRKPDQIIDPWEFAITDEEKTLKKTCLWLKGLKPLKPLHTERPEIAFHEWTTPEGKTKRQTLWYYKTRCLSHSERAKAASKTFPGIARAMAEQWG